MTGAVSGEEEKRMSLRRGRYQLQMINFFRAAILGVGIAAIGGTLGAGTLVLARARSSWCSQWMEGYWCDGATGFPPNHTLDSLPGVIARPARRAA